MNRTEASDLVIALNRAGLVGAMEGQTAVWADALEDVAYTTATEVVRTMIKTRTSTQRWVTPGDIAAEVRTIRKTRVDNMQSPQPPSELDGVPAREIAWRRAYVSAVADGSTEPVADLAACQAVGVHRAALDAVQRPVAPLVSQLASTTRIPRRNA